MNRILILTLLAVSTFLIFANGANSPVVIIPGLTEAQLESKLNKTTRRHPWCTEIKDWHPIWYDETLLLPPYNECFLDNFQLVYDNETRQSSSPEGVEIKPIGYGNLEGLNYYDTKNTIPFWVNLTAPLIQNYSYVVGYDLFGAPYDWRYGPNRYVNYEYPQLVQLIEYAYNQTNLPVVIVSVSMGGPYTALFLNLQSLSWKEKYIRGWVSLSSVLSGSSDALSQLVSNDPTGLFRLVHNIDEVSKTFPSIAWLMPSTLAFSPDQTFAVTPNGNFSISNFTELFVVSNETYPAGELYQDTLPYTNFSAPEVEVYCVWGYNLTTPNVVIITDDYNNATAVNGDGDTIVLVESLAVCSNEVWGAQQQQPVHTIPQANVPHAGQLETPEGVQMVIDLIVNKLAPVNNNY